MFLSVKKRIPSYMKTINTSDYIQHPDNRDFVNKKSDDPPNIRPTPCLTKSLTVYISRGVYYYGKLHAKKMSIRIIFM